MLRCPRCQRENEDDARLCRECGAGLTGREPVGVAASVAGPTAASTTCPSCGQPAPADSQFCASCGKTLGVVYASFWTRLGGFLIDGVIVLVIASIPAAIVSSIIIGSMAPEVTLTQEQVQEKRDAELAATIAMLVIYLVIPFAYHVLLNANGGTLGKRAVGIRLEHAETGENIGIGRALARYVVAIASFLAILLGYLWCIWDDKKQTWHDKAANSIVVRA